MRTISFLFLCGWTLMAQANVFLEISGTVTKFNDQKVTLNVSGAPVTVQRATIDEKVLRPGQQVTVHLTGKTPIDSVNSKSNQPPPNSVVGHP
jgi:hypothetical protein